MASITFIEHNGEEHTVDIDDGKSLMEIAMDNGLPGIDADCGGECACGTCHVIVDPKFTSITGVISDEEEQMLDMTPDRAATSRLSCQIKVTNEFDGVVVRLPEFQM